MRTVDSQHYGGEFLLLTPEPDVEWRAAFRGEEGLSANSRQIHPTIASPNINGIFVSPILLLYLQLLRIVLLLLFRFIGTYIPLVMAAKTRPSIPPSSKSIGRANPIHHETSRLLAPNSDEEEGPIEEPWTSRSLGSSFVWIETGITPSSYPLTAN
jgi:hypothetical protein